MGEDAGGGCARLREVVAWCGVLVGIVFDSPSDRFEGRAAIQRFDEDIHLEIRGSMHFNDNHQFERRDGHVRHRCYSALQLRLEEGVRTQLMTYDDVVVQVDGEWLFEERVNRFFDPSANS